MPSGICVSTLVTRGALSYPESHSHLSFVNVIAVTYNEPMAVKIARRALACCHVECTVNKPRRTALGAIEREIPAATAVVTVVNPEVPSEVDIEGSVCVVLQEFTVL